MHLHVTIVFDESQSPKSIHKETHSRPGCPNHFRQHFLTDFRDNRFWLAVLAKLGKQQEDSGQPLLAGIKKLVNQIFLNTHFAGQQKCDKNFKECLVALEHADHLFPLNLEERAWCKCRSC
jgi:hypothetical protein